MTFAPRQNWDTYREAIAEHVARNAKVGLAFDDPVRLEAALDRYTDYVDTLLIARRDLLRASTFRLAEDPLTRWSEKIALRQRLVAIYQSMDVSRDG